DVFRGWVSSIGKAVTAKEVITRTVKVTNVGKPSVAEERSKITPVTAIKVTPTGTVEKGKTTTLTVTVEPENATDKTFRAISADPSKATISVKDMTITVTGVKDGKVSIPVISGNGQFAAVAEITVNNVPGG
ncbi:Ig domain-containing protein, partial [Escherichia coli]